MDQEKEGPNEKPLSRTKPTSLLQGPLTRTQHLMGFHGPGVYREKERGLGRQRGLLLVWEKAHALQLVLYSTNMEKPSLAGS